VSPGNGQRPGRPRAQRPRARWLHRQQWQLLAVLAVLAAVAGMLVTAASTLVAVLSSQW
jgi:hypothetical protein